ncbi:hypothetical protein P7C70_g8668, partial [Phenoliferia sp. Uapishka_3]
MPPTPPQIPLVPTPPPKREWPTPPIHLKVADLSHSGAQRFFAAVADPGLYKVLEGSATIVQRLLYPDELRASEERGGDETPPLLLSGTSTYHPPPGPPPIRSITFFLRSFDGVAFTRGSHLDNEHKEIHISTSYIAGISGDEVRIKREIEGVLVHELVHVFQWDGEGSCDGGVVEGIADWVRLGAGLGAPHWKEGGGKEG